MGHILAEAGDLPPAGCLHGNLEVNGLSHVNLLVKQLGGALR